MEKYAFLILIAFLAGVMFVCALISKLFSEASFRRENKRRLKEPAVTEDLKDRFK